jgi:hypothetical protein
MKNFKQVAIMKTTKIRIRMIRRMEIFSGMFIHLLDLTKILIFTHTSYIGITLVFIHKLVVRARQLSLCAQLAMLEA